MIDPVFTPPPAKSSAVSLAECGILRCRGSNDFIIQCDEFGRPYNQVRDRVQVWPNNNPHPGNTTMTSTVEEINPVPPEQAKIDETAYQAAAKALEEQRMIDAAKYEELIKSEGGNPIAIAMDILKRALKADDKYAWSWHCNVAMPMHDSMPEITKNRHAISNRAAGFVMRHVFDVDTISTYESQNNDPS